MNKKYLYLFIPLVLLASSCSKELGTKTFMLQPVNSSGITGFIRGTEDGSKTKIEIVLSGTDADTLYDVHFHEGPPNGYKGFAPYSFMKIKGLKDNTHHETDIDLSYNDFVKFDGTCVVHAASSQNVLAIGGIGKNGE